MRWGDDDDRCYALAELGLATGGALACWFWPQARGWPVLVGLLPWLMRLARRRFPFQPTVLDAPMGIFLASALVGVWSTYDQGAGWAKFWLMAAGMLLAYALVRQPHANLPLVTRLLGVCGSGVAVYFLFTQDWTTFPADLGVINRLGIWWMGIRPNFGGNLLHPNIAGGLMAFFAPFGLALLLLPLREKRPWRGFFALLNLGLTIFGLAMSSSRAAWFALAIALSLWGIWAGSRKLSPARGRQVRLWLSLVIPLLAGGMLWILWRFPELALAWLTRLPGPHSAISRLEIMRDSLRLVRDFAYTGGGLQSFPGLYAHYMRAIRVFLFGYAHNLFLDVAIEQGMFGLGAWVALLAGSGWLLLKARGEWRLRGAALSSLVVLVLHGLADDPLYSQGGTPFLFVLPALALALSRSQEPAATLPQAFLHKTTLSWAGLSLGLTGLFLLIANRGDWLAAWEANLGAVKMARVELAGFPSEGWGEGNRLPQLAPAQSHLERALERDPSNVTASYRLGLIALNQDNFNTARIYLEAAYNSDPGHRGVRKRLGYVYAWMGDFKRAAQMLRSISEAPQELEVYAWWWKTQGRDDLSLRAEQLLAYLAKQGP